jgi:OPA family glycerol-3-phosphate transporter-like MFS transporter
MGWITYASFYLGRVNLSIAMPDLRESLQLSAQDVGLLGSGFFLSYALGQLISGYLGDRISPRKLVFGGMLLSTVMNLVFGFSAVWSAMFLAWTINGLFQSTGWAPIMKVLSNWCSPEQKRKVAGIYATSYVAGNALTWILTGWLVAYLNWRAAFWIPGALMGIFALVWYVAVRDTPRAAGFAMPVQAIKESDKRIPQEDRRPNMLHVLRRFWPLVLAAVSGGMLLFALIIWTPTYFVDVHGLGIDGAAIISTLFPIAGTVGTLSVAWLVAGRFRGREIRFAIVVFIGIGALLLLFSVVSSLLWISTLLMVLVGSILYGVDTIITTILPMVLGSRREVSTVAGLIDFAFNIGASLAGVLIGFVVDTYSWSAVFVTLAMAAGMTGFFLAVFAWWLARTKGVRQEPMFQET